MSKVISALITGEGILPITNGGTGSSSASQARTSLGIVDGIYKFGANTFNEQIGATYTLLESDNGKVVILNSAAAVTVTVPAGLSVGFSCLLIQLGAGTVTVTGSSTTVNSYSSFVTLAGQYATANIIGYSEDNYILAGMLA